MTLPAIRIDGLGKRYKLGVTHAGSIRNLVNGTAARLVGKQRARSREQGAENSSLHAPGSPLPAERVDDDGHFWALRDVSFEVQPGEVVGIIGKNGAGKSTLLKLLSRITTPTEGEIQLRGRVASLLEVGTGFHPELTGRENVYLNGTILGMSKAEVDRQFDAIVDFAGIEKFIDTPVKRYSSGMTVRLGFAVAAHLDPEILIVDEVLAVGDVEFQRRCLGKMAEAAESGKTVLFVSHNLASIRTLTKRSVVLAMGEKVFDGPTPEALNLYIGESSRRQMSSHVANMERPFSGLGRELEFVELSLDPSSPSRVQNEDSIIAITTVRANREAGSFLIGITVFRDDFVPVGSTFSDELKQLPMGVSQQFEVMLPTHSLAPGRYHCAISLSEMRSGNRELLDSLSDVLSFEIAPPSCDSRGWQSAWGPVQFDELHVVESKRRQSTHLSFNFTT